MALHAPPKAAFLVLAAALLVPAVAGAEASGGVREMGPDLAYVTTVARVPGDPKTILAGTWGDGLYWSSDGGSTWQRAAGEAVAGARIASILTDPAHPGRVLATTDRARLLRSVDGGRDWQPVDPPLSPTAGGGSGAYPSSAYTAAFTDPRDSAVYVLSAGNGGFGYENPGLLVSHDGGASWIDLTAQLPEVVCPPQSPWWPVPDPPCFAAAVALALDAAGGSFYMATDDGGLFKTSDPAAGWTQVAETGAAPSLLCAPPGVPEVLLAVASVGSERALWRSTDGGTSFAAVLELDRTASWIRILTDPRQPGVLVLLRHRSLTEGLPALRSADGGATWQETTLGDIVGAFAVNDLAFAAGDGAPVLAATSLGVFASAGGGAWQPSSAGLQPYMRPGAEDLAFAADAPGTVYVATSLGGVWRSRDDGATWAPLAVGMPEVGTFGIEADPLDPATLYAVGRRGTYRTRDRGDHWETLAAAPEPAVPSWGDAGIGVIRAAPWSEGLLFATSRAGLLRSRNRGDDWEVVQDPSVDGVATELLVDPCIAGRVWIDTDNAGVRISDDDGEHWRAAGPGLPRLGPTPEQMPVTGFAAAPGCHGTVYVSTAFDGGCYRTGDGGATWTRVGGERMDEVRLVAVSPAFPGSLFGLTDGDYRLVRHDDGWACWGDAGGPRIFGVMAFDPHHPETVWAGGESSTLTAFKAADLPPLTLCDRGFLYGWEGIPFRGEIGVSGGEPPYTWTVADPPLPAGITFDPATGVLSGVPRETASRFYTLDVASADGSAVSGVFRLSIYDQLRITDLKAFTHGSSILRVNFSVSGSGGTGWHGLFFRWDFGDGSPPESGTDVVHRYGERGTYTVKVTLSDGASPEATAQVRVVVGPRPLRRRLDRGLGHDPEATAR